MYLTDGFLPILYTPFTLFYGRDIDSNVVWGSRMGVGRFQQGRNFLPHQYANLDCMVFQIVS